MRNPYLALISTVWHYGKPWRFSIVGYYLAYCVAQACLSLTPYALGRTVDVLQNFVPGRLNEVVVWLVMVVVLVLVFWLFHGPARVVERKVALKIQQSFRLNVYEQLTHLPLKWHQDHHSGNIITRLSRASVALYRFAESQFIYIQAIIKFSIAIGFLLWLSVPVGVVSLVTSVLVGIIVILFDRRLVPLYDAQNEVDNRVGAVLFDYINNITTVLTLRLGELTHSNLGQRLMSMWPFFTKNIILNEVKWFVMITSLTIIQSAILIGYIVYNLNATGTVLIGVVVMIFRYQWDLSMVFHELSSSYSDLVRMNTDVQGMAPILKDIAHLAHLPQGAAIAHQWHTLSIENLSFHHDVQNSPIRRGQGFHNMAFTVKRGEKIALIGASGGGKSTLLNLLCGLYTASNVGLTIDGIRFHSLEPLQAITTLIPQEPEIFENTIAFNITMDLPTQALEIAQAVELAGFSEVLASLPAGLHTDIREKGLNLSVGQKQRLALARGLFAARFSSLILMDEPTSSVDLPTEKKILSGVIGAFPDAAVMVSLHRLHLLSQFDSVIMLKNGEILASGKTALLLKTPGPVRDLWESYMQGERVL